MKRNKFLASVLMACVLFSSVAVQSMAVSNIDEEFVTSEMVQKYKVSTQQQIAQGKEIMEQEASGKIARFPNPLAVSLLLQDDPIWGNHSFPCGHTTYASAGCAMTSYAMISKYNIYSLETPETFTKKYYDRLKSDPCNQTADKAASVMGLRVTAAASAGSGALKISDVNAAVIAGVKNGDPTVLRTNAFTSHYVLAIGYELKNGNYDIIIRDPEGDVGFTRLSQYLSKYYVREYATIG